MKRAIHVEWEKRELEMEIGIMRFYLGGPDYDDD